MFFPTQYLLRSDVILSYSIRERERIRKNQSDEREDKEEQFGGRQTEIGGIGREKWYHERVIQ